MVKNKETYPNNLINVEKNKKLQEILGKKETQRLIKENFRKYKILEERIHILSETQTELLDLKRELTGTPEEKADKLLKIIEKQENSSEYKISEEIKANKEKVKKELREKADKKIPFIGGILFDFVSKIDTKNDNSWLGNILKYLKSGILSWLGIENLDEQLNETKLNEKQIKETKEKVTEYLVKNLKLEGKEDEINKILNNKKIFTSEKLLEYYKKIKSGNGFSANDLMKDFGNIGNINENIKENLKNLDKKAFEKIYKFIYKKFDKILDEGDSEDLKNIIKKYITNGSLSNEKLNEILDKKSFKIADLYPLLGDGAMFMLELVGKGVIDLTDIAFDFASKGGDMINLSIGIFGLSDSISTDSLIEKINGLEEKEKALLIGILYRKGGLFLSIVGNIAAATTRIGLDILLGSNSGVDGLKIFNDGLFKGPAQQLKNMSKIEQAITGVADNIYITKVKDSFKMLEENYKIMSIIGNSKDIEGFKKQLNGKNGVFINKYLGDNFNINKYSDLDEISKLASKRVGSGFVDDFEIKFEKGKNHFIKEKIFGFGKSSAMQELNRAIGDTVKHQQNVLDKGFGYYSKFRETLSASKISHLSDKLVFEFENKKGAKTFLKQMNVLAQSSPELIKGIFNKLPIISVVGLAANGEGTFFEEIRKESLYLIPIIGPILIIGKGGLNWNDGNPKIDNPENVLLGGGLLTLDFVSFFKEKGFLKKIKYLGKPIIDLFDIGKGTAEFIQKTGKIVKTGKTLDNPKNFIEKIKSAKIKPKGIYVLGAILTGYITYEMLKTEGYEEIMGEYYKDGKYNFEKAREDYNKMDLEEKEKFIRLLFPDSANEIININIKDNIEIISKDKTKLNGDWFIDKKKREIFEQIIGKKIIFKYS